MNLIEDHNIYRFHPVGAGLPANDAPRIVRGQSPLLQGVLLLLLVIFTLGASASEQDQDRARALSRSGAIVPLEQITAQVRARDIGHILEVELESDDQEYYYEVEVVDDAGIVRKLRYDAVTGELLSDSPDD